MHMRRLSTVLRHTAMRPNPAPLSAAVADFVLRRLGTAEPTVLTHDRIGHGVHLKPSEEAERTDPADGQRAH